MGQKTDWFKVYSKEEVEWAKKNFHAGIERRDIDRETVERDFERVFGRRLKFSSLYAMAHRLGLRERTIKVKVGETVYIDKRGRERVLVSLNPRRYKTKSRYEWERQNKRKLKSSEVVVHINGDNRDYSKDNLAIIDRAELARLSENGGLPNKTKLLLAKLETKKGDMIGRGRYSKEEVEWIRNIELKSRAKRGFWKDVADDFNKRFNKNRSNMDLAVLWRDIKGYKRERK